MSHQTGIQPNEELVAFMSKSKTNARIRVIKVGIKREQLVLEEQSEAVGKWEDDYQQFVKRMVLEKQPCYLLLRLDTRNAQGFEWLFIAWSPEFSPVREKMLYASTKATLKMDFGGNSIVADYFASSQEEMSLALLKGYLERKNQEENGEHDQALLTTQEQDLKDVKRNEALSSCLSKGNKSMPGVEFPITGDAIDALFDLKEGLISYLQLGIDFQKEEIRLESKEGHKDFDIKDLQKKVPPKSARYHLILYPHNYDGLFFKSIIFIYSIPGDTCSVKERMLYSSCKNALLTAIQDKDKMAIEITKKLEIDDPDDLTLDYIMEELHPKENIARSKFAKPKGPAGKRGAKRLIKSSDE